MLVTLTANSWFINIIASFFVSLLDSCAYLLLAAAYNIFYAVSQIDIFGTPGGHSVYEEITTKIYTALSIVMVFVFAYYLILMIVDPDGGKGKTTSSLVKETILAFITVIILPTIFSYMTLFQTHVIADNTIGNLILGGANGGDNGDFGKKVSLIVLTSFYHPKGTSYSDYFNDEGFVGEEEAFRICTEGGGSPISVCPAWARGLQEWVDDDQWLAVDSITGKSALYESIGETYGMSYMWVVTTVVGVITAWFFFSYAIDIGTRAVKLGFLQLVAPVPVLLKIFPQGKKTFDSWFAEIKKCYLEIFVRLAIIFFIVKLCTMAPMFIDAVWESGNGISGGFLTKALATVCLILGLLKFAKDAPQLFKTIFASGGGLLAGLDLKPGMKRKISENEYAMKGISMGAGLAGGLGSLYTRGRRAYREVEVQGNNNRGSALAYGIGSAIKGLPRALITGAKAGFKNTPTELSAKNLANSAGSGLSASQASDINRHNKATQDGHLIPFYVDENGDVKFDKFKRLRSGVGNLMENMSDSRENMQSTLRGEKLNNAAVDTIKKATENMNAVIKLKDVKNIDNAFDKLEEKIRTEGFVKYGDKYYSLYGNSVDDGNGNIVNTAKLSDLKYIFNQQKNQALAKTINDSYREGVATYMANVEKQLSKELGNLGAKYVNKINSKIADGNLTFRDSNNVERKVTNINDFLLKLSNTNENVTEQDMKVLKDIKTTMSDISKNIVITEQAKNAGKEQEKKDGK